METDEPPTCPECGTPAVLTRKWNSGQPADLWLDDCECAEQRTEAEGSRFGRWRIEGADVDPHDGLGRRRGGWSAALVARLVSSHTSSLSVSEISMTSTMVAMALRREDLTPEQLALQEAYDRSWESLQRVRADPEMMAFLKDCLRRLDERPSAPRLTKEEFLAQAGLT